MNQMFHFGYGWAHIFIYEALNIYGKHLKGIKDANSVKEMFVVHMEITTTPI